MKKFLFVAGALSLLLSSCDKDWVRCEKCDVAKSSTSYFPLTQGTYWIYEHTTLDTNGVETVTSLDSSYVSNDTVIGGKTYTKVFGNITNSPGFTLLRDSADCVVKTNGTIIFSASNYTDTLSKWSVPGYLEVSNMMAQFPQPVVVPAGSFIAKDNKGTAVFTNPSYPWSNPRYTHNYYSKGVGLIREITFFTSSPDYVTRRLIRYHIE